MSKTILVTLSEKSLTPQIRSAVEEYLSPLAEPVLLAELDPADRAEAFARADTTLFYKLGEELTDDDYRHLKPGSLLQSIFTGVERLPYKLIPKEVQICGNSGGWADPIGEHALALMLALGKNLFTARRDLAKGKFERSGTNLRFKGKTCGLVGFGGIGRAVAERARALGMRIAALNTSGRTAEPVDSIGTLAELPSLLAEARVLVLCLPLTKASRGLIGRAELEMMKPEAILINVARGPIVDQAALYNHLRANPGFKAAFDVWWKEPGTDGGFSLDFPLLELDNFTGTPHCADHVAGMMAEALRSAMDNVARFFRGEPLTGLVDRREYV